MSDVCTVAQKAPSVPSRLNVVQTPVPIEGPNAEATVWTERMVSALATTSQGAAIPDISRCVVHRPL